jgi:hypothetical protein
MPPAHAANTLSSHGTANTARALSADVAQMQAQIKRRHEAARLKRCSPMRS